VLFGTLPEKEGQYSNEPNKVKNNMPTELILTQTKWAKKGSIKLIKTELDTTSKTRNDNGKIRLIRNGIDIDIKDQMRIV